MPKEIRKRYHAVRVGRQGPRIYDTWDECEENTSRFPGALHRGFMSLSDAQDWLSGFPCARCALAESTDKEDGTHSSLPVKTEHGEKAPITVAPPIVLSDEQRVVLQRIEAKQNVFFTGSAGCFAPQI
ncbi:hypothetical protein OF83DRAFT_71950 [Amylostereum chailletii]|nr:hypothetical protein OF83DRAFT_71950 [Amylostereum chailletii]